MSVLRYFITSKAKRSVLKLFLSHSDSAFYTREVARLTAEPLNAVRRELGYLEKAGLLHSYMQGNLKYYEVVKTFPVLAEWQKIILFTPNVDQEHIQTSAKADKPIVIAPQPPEEEAVLEEEIISEMEEDEAVEKATPEPAPELQEEEAITVKPAGQPELITTSAIVNILHNELQNMNNISLAIVHGEAARSEEIPEEGIDLLVVGDITNENMLELLTEIEDDTGVPINLVRMTRSDFDYRNAKGDPLIRRIWSEKKLLVKGRH